jgi:hypothetical protein
MEFEPHDYYDDKVLRDALERVGAKLTLHEIYGLFYGCIAATHMVLPSQYIPLIFGEEPEFESLEEANSVMGSLMALWNLLASWKPEEHVYYYPETGYAVTSQGLIRRVNDGAALIQISSKGSTSEGPMRMIYLPMPSMHLILSLSLTCF